MAMHLQKVMATESVYTVYQELWASFMSEFEAQLEGPVTDQEVKALSERAHTMSKDDFLASGLDEETAEEAATMLALDLVLCVAHREFGADPDARSG